MALPGNFQYATVATSPTQVAWSNGESFDGYVMIMLAMPSGYVGLNAFVAGFNPVMPLAQRWRFFIANGYIDAGSTLPYTTSLEPPNTQYAAFWYDLNDILINTTSAMFTVSSSPVILTAPALAAPTAASSLPNPGTGPSPTTGGGYSANETPSGTQNGINTIFTLAHNPNPSGLLELYKNGVLQNQGVDYTLASNTITYTFAPQSGDVIRAFYQY